MGETRPNEVLVRSHGYPRKPISVERSGPKNKNDRNDAERLAKLLYLGETQAVHVPSLEVFEVCYEASCGYGHFHDLLRPLAARVPGALNDLESM
jgi:hypothetical protein